MLYDPYIDIFYNILFTAYPIGWFATYDKERNYDELENNPKFYRKGLENGYFNIYVFWQWYFYGLIGGILIFWFVSLVNSRNDLEDLWLIGHTVLLCIILVVNTKLLIKTKSHNLLSLILFLFSNTSYILILYFSDKSQQLNTYQFFSKTFANNITFYLLVILIVSSCMMGEYAWETSMILLQSFIGVIQKTVSEIKTKKVNEKKKESMRKEFEANRQKEKEDKFKLEQDMSRDYKIDFYSNSINHQLIDLNKKIVEGEEPELPELDLNREDNVIGDFDKNIPIRENVSEGGKTADERLLGYTRRCMDFLLFLSF
jgi:magnesium-transporting ATPase (P-type)